MKKNLLVSLAFFITLFTGFGQSQCNLIVFSDDGDLFFAYVNGIRQNDQPQANVKITGLTSPNVSLRVEFNDKTLPQLKQNMALEPGFEHTAKIIRDKNKQLKLRYFGQTPLDNASAPDANTVVYHSAENSPAGDNSSYSNTATTVTSSTVSTQGNTANSSVNVNVGGAGITMNVSGRDPNSHGMNTTSSTTVTSSSSSSSSSSNYSGGSGNTSSSSSAPSNVGCSSAMSQSSFEKMKQSVGTKPFSDTKMSTAKVATKNACLLVSQVKGICKLFSTDDDKLSYAKFAYDYTVDKANYYQVSEVFSFSTTTDDLNKFLEQH